MFPGTAVPLVPYTLHYHVAAQRFGLQNDMFLWGLIVAEHGLAKGLVHKYPGSGKGVYRWDPYFWRVAAQAKDEMYKEFCDGDGGEASAHGRSGLSGGSDVIRGLPTVFPS